MPTMPSPVTIPDTELRMLSSSVIDQEFSICVALPHSYTKDSKAYPVVYVLDANAMFGIVTETVRLLAYDGLPDVIIVGIGYPVATYTVTFGLRTRDMTPTEIDAAWYDKFISYFPEQPAYAGAGGAAHFLRFIREELMPFVNTNYRTMQEDSTLMGDSFGGLFSLYAFFSQPDTFQRYVIGSPSIWWDDQVIFRLEKDLAAQHSDLSAKVCLSVGGSEDDGMIAGMYKVAEALRNRAYKSMELTTRFFEGETHASVVPAFASWGLRTAFAQKA